MVHDWHYYDGPLTGILTWNGTRYWFDVQWETADQDGFPWLYDVGELSADDWAKVDVVVEAFEAHIGLHCSYRDGRHAAMGHHRDIDWNAYNDVMAKAGIADDWAPTMTKVVAVLDAGRD